MIFEEFLASGNPIDRARGSTRSASTFPELPRVRRLARNVTMLRTARVDDRPARRAAPDREAVAARCRWTTPKAFRQLMLEVAVGMLTARPR